MCPLVSMIAFLALGIDNLLNMWMKCRVYRRRLPEPLTTMKPWNQMQQVISYSAVLTNTYLLFAYSAKFREFAWEISTFGMKLYNVILLEHVLLLTIVIIRYLFPTANLIEK